jgi:hypothetical protein
MINEPRTYRHSPIQLVLLLFVLGVLALGMFTTMAEADYSILVPFGLLFGMLLLFAIHSATSKTIISDTEISTQTILGARTLAWNEISRVSGRGFRIKLHNNFGDVTVSPNQQLPGYDEVINWIGIKRPDLFNPLDYSEMSKSWAGTILLPVIGLLFMGFGFFIFTQANNTVFPIIMLFIIGLIFIGIPLFSAQAVSLQGNTMVIGYLFNQKTLLADEISSVDFRYTQTRNGKNYFIAINLANRRIIRISGLSVGLPVAFLVLKNWHEKQKPAFAAKSPFSN